MSECSFLTDEIEGAVKRWGERLEYGKVSNILNGANFTLAGGALSRAEPNDYDIYGLAKPINIVEVDWEIQHNHPDCKVIDRTKNALTVAYKGQKIQFCTYFQPTPQKLIESFDFAHCQVATTFGDSSDVFVTDEWVEAKAIEGTFYTGSEYPLSSLVRAGKFYKQGKFASKASYELAAMQILNAIVQRGFANWSDFQNQINAVSSGMLEYDACRSLFAALEKPRPPKTDDDNMPF